MISTTDFQSLNTKILCLIIGSGAVLILGIQPLILGALLNSGVIDAIQLGWTATVEVVAMGIGVLVGTPLLRHGRAKQIVFAAAIVTALANLGTWQAGAVAGVMVLRCLTGLANGLLIAVSVLCITYSNSPGRMNAIFLSMGAVPQLAAAYALPAFIAPRFGIGSGFVILALVGALSGILALAVRDRFAPPVEETTGKIVWTPLVVVALAASLVTAAAVGACWAYVEPMGAAIGLSPEQIGLAVTISLLFQLLSTLVVSTVGWRIPFAVPLLGGAIGQIAVAALLLNSTDMVLFSTGIALFGFLWQGCMPFGVDLIISVDASRATAPLMLPLNFFGLSAGPLIASFFVGDSVSGAFQIALVGFVGSLVLYTIIFLTARGRMSASDPDVAEVVIP
ncbi:MFS transporter [Novosphingobium sp. B-7]|uniref:MFS transporter n=1 Tax=Novosphingobium sp. B-7 TaxID=1298855 RepID=UPI0003B74B47|nr:MFS transporter [Novosphingobium sp. B-7]